MFQSHFTGSLAAGTFACEMEINSMGHVMYITFNMTLIDAAIR